ncbi:Thiamine-phosphate synthase [Novipirellula aureliae]|uniref:Thiamine-phosphate synthase n=1 Tax=Novipirellula aureliae TaxID=2527966 RepID=A0A5C6DGA4_9BACT|nr:thiamine phosphate synthase [Novipirellula aureliae]TWU35830.1 Thiamine-phosphate synthase [Novipirellula aureliae]
MIPDSLTATYRILDASINRVSEGIRTIEEYSRFEIESVSHSESFKSLRHQLTRLVNTSLSRSMLLAARNTPDDIGTVIQTKAEYNRTTKIQIVAAASSRIQQSLRVIEEYGKTIDAGFAKEVEQLRYQAYHHCASIERLVPVSRRQRLLEQAKLYLLMDVHEDLEMFVASIRSLAAAGVDVFQLRDKDASDRTLYERSVVAAKLAIELDCLFLVNDRADIAAAADSDGVHVGQDELPAKIARQVIGDSRLVGVSTHTVQEIEQAQIDGANYIGCGPVFGGRTKSFSHYVGTAFLEKAATMTTIPAFAIGGIDETNVNQVIDAGFDRIAVTGALRDAEDPAAAAAHLKAILVN